MSFRPTWRLAGIVLASIFALPATAWAEEGFQSLFDGQTLDGWHPRDVSYWTVEEGAITGRITPEHPCAVNQYLVWQDRQLADFELKLESRLRGQGAINNGFQFRSLVLPDGDVCGYQVDNNLQTDWLVRLYDEYGRHTLAMRGERTVFDRSGGRVTERLAEVPVEPWFRLEDWHEYHLKCVGSRLELRVDGRWVAEVVDDDWRRQDLQGALALQLHSGPPTEVQFRHIRLRPVAAARPPIDEPVERSSAERSHRDTLGDALLAWWPLFEGGHGASPPLQHIPAWEQFELNVRPDGNGARREKILLLNGAYLESKQGVNPDGDRLTVYLRLRDPNGLEQSPLLSQVGEGDEVQFQLLSASVPESDAPVVKFQVQTDRERGTVEFSVRDMDRQAWHDLVGRYDGESLSLFCDGQRMAQSPCHGRLIDGPAPLRIGAQGPPGSTAPDRFRGELAEAAVWSRALSDHEITLLSSP